MGPGVIVYDVHSGRAIEVPAAEAMAGLIRFARSLGPGTPACAVLEQRAIELARETKT